jgi:hypothetical protein
VFFQLCLLRELLPTQRAEERGLLSAVLRRHVFLRWRLIWTVEVLLSR